MARATSSSATTTRTAPQHVASLIVVLPTEQPFEGGALRITRPATGGVDRVEEDGEVLWDTATSPAVTGTLAEPREGDMQCDSGHGMQVQWAAFWRDCEHELLHIESGHRVALHSK